MRNLSVLEGGRGRFQNGVRRVIADLQGGGTSIWVPADERLLKTKYITENGTYLASAEELWGFSKLTVNVAGGAEGTQVPTVDKDGNPTDYQVPTYGPVTVDPNIDPSDYPTLPPISGGIGSQISGIDPITGAPTIATVGPDGQITTEELPTELVIWRMPDKTVFDDGEEIRYDGIVCRLKRANGSWYDVDPYTKEKQHQAGKVPFDELIFTEKIADISKAAGKAGYYSDYDLSAVNYTQPVHVCKTVVWEEWYNNAHKVCHFEMTADGDAYILISMTRNSNGSPYVFNCFVISQGNDPNVTTRISSSYSGESWTVKAQKWSTGWNNPEALTIDGHTNYMRQAYRFYIGDPYTYQGVTYYDRFISGEYNDIGQNSDTMWGDFNQQQSVARRAVLQTVFGGTYVPYDTLSLPVQWKRKDGVVLSSSFDVTVTAAGGGGGGFSGGGGGGQGGDGGGGAF